VKSRLKQYHDTNTWWFHKKKTMHSKTQNSKGKEPEDLAYRYKNQKSCKNDYTLRMEKGKKATNKRVKCSARSGRALIRQ